MGVSMSFLLAVAELSSQAGVKFDWTVNIPTLLLVAGGIVSFLWGAVHVRDTIRDLSRSMRDIFTRVDDLEKSTSRDHEHLTEMRGALGFNGPRSYRPHS
jgi:hypothetical protein